MRPSGCVAIAYGGAVYYCDGASVLWRLLCRHRCGDDVASSQQRLYPFRRLAVWMRHDEAMKGA